MLAFTIAARYLFAPKSHRTINAITLVAAVGVAIISAALVCTVSVYNGFESLVDELCSAFDPDLRIEPARGKTFADSPELRHALLAHRDIEAVSATLEEDVLLAYGQRQVTALMKGVDTTFADVCRMRLPIIAGQEAALGAGLASQLRVGAGFVRPLTVYCPRRAGRISLLHPDDAFREGDLYCSGLFAVEQAEYDDRLLLTDIAFARHLLADSSLVTAYEVRLSPGADAEAVRRDIVSILNAAAPTSASPQGAPAYTVLTRRQLHADAYRIMQVEKWVTFLLVAFILLIASFNVIGALSMLIIDKEPEIRTLRSLGATDGLIRRIFVLEGWLISGTGAVVGIAMGVLLCLAQQHFGFITLGDGSGLYVVDAYPVRVLWTDVVWALACIGAIGLIVSLIAGRQATTR